MVMNDTERAAALEKAFVVSLSISLRDARERKWSTVTLKCLEIVAVHLSNTAFFFRTCVL